VSAVMLLFIFNFSRNRVGLGKTLEIKKNGLMKLSFGHVRSS